MKRIINRRIQRTADSKKQTVVKKDMHNEPLFFDPSPQQQFFTPAQPLKKTAGTNEEDKLYNKEKASANIVPSHTTAYVAGLNGKGQPLPAHTQSFFSARLGHDLSKVKVHTDEAAAASAGSVHAKAYAVGNHIVFNKGQYDTESAAGKKLLAHELVHTIQDEPTKIMTDKLDAKMITGWNTIMGDATAANDKKDMDEEEKQYVKALALIGETTVNIARGGYTDPSKLKPGINLDITDTHAAGSTGYLNGNSFTGRLPLDRTYPPSAIVFNRLTFGMDILYTKTVVAHERQHMIHQQEAIKIIKKWDAKGNTTVAKKDFEKQKKTYLVAVATQNLDAAAIDRGLAEIQGRIIYTWYTKQKGSTGLSADLLLGQITTMQAQSFDSEVLSDLAGFTSAFHFTTIKDGKATPDIFFQLTGYAAGSKMWGVVTGETKKYFEATINNYFHKKLDADHQKVFIDQVELGTKKATSKEVQDFYAMLTRISSTK